jgi:hypothetical protein
MEALFFGIAAVLSILVPQQASAVAPTTGRLVDTDVVNLPNGSTNPSTKV